MTTDDRRAGRDATPDGMQRLLNFYSWSADGVRDDVRDYVAAAIGDPAGVLICDETGFLKKGTRFAGVQRQYSGTAGRIENCQLGLFLAYAVPGGGRALIDRELYLPESWTGDRDRCAQAGIGEGTGFATKPELARQMIGRAIDAGVPFGWVAADEAYGQNPPLRDWLAEHLVSYVLAVPKSFTVAAAAGPRRADALAGLVPAAGWQQISCGDGAKGPRFYDWALIGTASPAHHLLVRRPVCGGELAFFACPCWPWRSSRSPQLKRGTSTCGQPCRTPALHNHDRAARGEPDLIHLTASEIRRLLTTITQSRHPDEHYQQWSRWRRRHQARARARARRSHYRRRLMIQQDGP